VGGWRYDRGMPSLPTILLILSFPAGALGYVATARIMQSLPLPDQAQQILTLFAPLFIAGLVMLPFLVPFFDRKAKQDLAAHARDQARLAEDSDDQSGEKPR